MEKIVLKINDFNIREDAYGKLNHVSFFVKGGRISALLGLDCAGPELIVRLLLGKLEMNWRREQVYYHGKKVSEYGQISDFIYYMKEGNHALNNWTVAEYVFSEQSTFFLLKSTLKKMNDRLQSVFETYHIDIDPMKKMGSLTELEYRKVEMVRGYLKGAKILIVEDECEGMSVRDLSDFASFLHQIIDEDMCMILLSHTEKVFQMLADDIVIFRKGRVVKKAFNINGNITFAWKEYLLGNTLIRRKSTIDSYERKGGDLPNIIYRVRNIKVGAKNMNLDFRKGEITTFVILDNKKREEFFVTLSGRTAGEGVRYIVEEQELKSLKTSNFIFQKIISATKLKSKNEIIQQMSIEDNLLLPSLKKLGAFQYSFENTHIKKSLYKEFAEQFLTNEKMVRELSSNELLALTLERWYIFRPKVMILCDVFGGNDPYGISIVQSYIKKFSNLGVAVILIESSLEYVETISDRIVDGIE